MEIVSALFFYLFASITVASGFMVIASRNPVHAVLFLILAFVNSAGLFILLGAEFLAMILIVVYVGAVAVLFLFRNGYADKSKQTMVVSVFTDIEPL